MNAKREGFDAERRLTTVSGNPYLAVKYRVQWLRSQAPDSWIETEMLVRTPEFALFRAVVTRIIDGTVSGIATGHGSETIADFRDYIEKAEQKAVGRALNALGFSVEAARSGRRAPAVRAVPSPARPAADPDGPATAEQVRAIADLTRKLGWTGERLDGFADQSIGRVDLADLAHRQAATLIQGLQAAQRRQRTVETYTP